MNEINKRDEGGIKSSEIGTSDAGAESNAGNYAARKTEAINFIGYALQKMAVDGAKGEERDAIISVSRELEGDAISPEEAKRKILQMGIASIKEGENLEGIIDEKEEANDFIFHILYKMAVRGANDTEYVDIRKILEDLDSDNIIPKEAKRRASELEGAKQDYR